MQKISQSLLSSDATDDRVRATFLLSDNSFVDRLPNRVNSTDISTALAAEAARAARQNENRVSSIERRIARRLDARHNTEIPEIRRAAVGVVSQSEAVQREIRRSGGTIVNAIPFPNQITAIVPRAQIAHLALLTSILRVLPASKSIHMSSPIDGSSVWHDAGFTGEVAPVGAGPDVSLFDERVSAGHLAFKTHVDGECDTCDGTGGSRIISPTARTNPLGNEHGNTIAATISSTALSSPSHVGMAYGLDKVYATYQADNPYLWNLGINSNGDPGLGGNGDLPEVINYSEGIYQDTVDLDPASLYFDALEDRFKILQVVSAGNCGMSAPLYEGCDGQHRVSTPGTNFNVLTMGGLQTSTVYPDTSGFAPWDNTSPGPTWNGRKKPDLIAPVFGVAGTPSAADNSSWVSGGLGTSFAAPVGAAGAILLASTGVDDPTAQKAIMINSATPVQGQTTWSPRSGWGAINMAAAFPDRGNYVEGEITGSDANGVRFYRENGVANTDRTTLVWNRRTNSSSILNPGYYNLTNLDLSQFDEADPLTPTADGGSDAAPTDNADTDPTSSTSNPMPGNGTDGGDNVEQVRSTGTGSQVIKVKAMTPIDGATEEPYSLAAHHALTALETPVPEVTVTVAPSIRPVDTDVQVTASVTNPSDDLDLDNASVDLNLPSGTHLVSGDTDPKPLALAAGDTDTAVWIVHIDLPGNKTFSATATGDSLGETFTGSGSDQLEVDSTPPTVQVATPPVWSTTTSPTFQWLASDNQAGIDHYDVETAFNGAPFSPLLTATSLTSVTVPAAEGDTVRLRVRAADSFNNLSDWVVVTTGIDAVPPTVSFGKEDTSKRGTVRVQVFFSNVGSPVKGVFTFADNSGGRTGQVTDGGFVSYTNTGSAPIIGSLRVVVTDELGRQASFAQSYGVVSERAPAGLKVKTVKRTRKGLAITGTIAKSYNGKVTLSAKRVGSKGTKRARKSVKPKNGKFKLSLTLKPGTYSVTVATAASKSFASASITQKLKLK